MRSSPNPSLRRAPLWLGATLLAALVLAGPHAARAQVSVDSSALDALGKPPATPAKPAPAPARPATPRPTPPATPSTAAPTKPGATAPAAPAAPAKPTAPAKAPAPTAPPAPPSPAITMPAAPPPEASLPPPAIPPAPPKVEPPPVPVHADAPGDASELPNGQSRVTFGPGRADLNPRTEAALRGLAARAAAAPGQPVNIYAYAPGTPEDPSTPRRLSLSRAQAARAVLLAAGVPSDRIYLHPMGDPGTASTAPADRLDIQLGGNAPPTRPIAQPAPPGAPAAASTAPNAPAPGLTTTPQPSGTVR